MGTESLAVIVEHVQVTRYLNAAGLVALLYDHMLTIDDEVRFIWKASTTLPKMLFLINRYTVPIILTIKANDYSGLAQPVFSDNYCKWSMSMSTIMGITTMSISNFLVLLRIWVIWDRKRRLMYWTGAGYIAAQISAFVVAGRIVSNMLSFMVYDPYFHACIYSRKPGFDLAALWIPGLVFEVQVFVVVWWNALDRPRVNVCQLSNALYRDGFFYFIILFSLRFMNLMLAIFAPASLVFLGIHTIWCASTITTSHFIFNLRKVSTDSDGNNILRSAIDAELEPSGLESVGTIVNADFEMQGRIPVFKSVEMSQT